MIQRLRDGGHRRPSGRRCTAVRPDRGGSPVEFAIVALGMLTLGFMVIQAGLVFYAKQIAHGAATQGVNVARGYQADRNSGVTHANRFLSQAGSGITDTNSTVDVQYAGGEAVAVTVTVTGRAISVIPFFTFDVEQSSHGAVERFVEDG